MEGSAHVPFILKPPASWRFGKMRRTDIPVTLCDIMPTFLEAAGVTPAYEPDGKSLLPLLKEDAVWERTYVYGENHRNMPMFGIQAAWSFVTDGRYKFLWDSVHGRELFFDLVNDPLECRNLAKDPAYANQLAAQRAFLIDELKKRPYDDLVDETNHLKWPRCLPSYRAPQQES
jgi:arylsulfatase